MNRPRDCPKTTVLICTLNKERNLAHVLPGVPDWVDETIVVDGYSTDRTVELAKELCPGARILYQPGKGKGNALRYGIENATGDIIVTLDTDSQTDLTEMPRFIAPLLDGYDFTKGSRLTQGHPPTMSWKHWYGNRTIDRLCNILFGTRFTDLRCGYNAFWRDRLLGVNPWARDDWNFEPLILARTLRGGLRITEVACDYTARVNGLGKLPDWRQGLTAIKVLLREPFRR